MTKRRRSGASKKQVEARFWGQTPLGGGSASAAKRSGFDGSGIDGSVIDGSGIDGSGAHGTPERSGEASADTETPRRPAGIRPTPDPGALVRSLGPPPLAVDPALSERHLTAVYEEAVRAATALAAANGLLAADDPDPVSS